MTDVAPDPHQLRAKPVAELFSLYRGILGELRSRGIVRTENAPAGDYAEFLVAAALDGELAPNSEKSWDVRLKGDERLQVKARVVSDPIKNAQRQLSPFRSFDFDEAVIVFFDDRDYNVRRAVRVRRDQIEAVAKFNSHVGGHIVHARPAFLDGESAIDITELLRQTAL